MRTARDGRRAGRRLLRDRDLRPRRRGPAARAARGAGSGCAIAAPTGVAEQPELAAAAAARLAENDDAPRPASRRSRAPPPAVSRSPMSPTQLDDLYAALIKRRRGHRKRSPADPLADRPMDRRRPAHAHLVVVRLHRRPGRARRPRDRGGARRDRRHRPQRLRRRARDARRGARARPDRHPRRGGQDRQPGRGDRALPGARDPARDDRSPTRSPRSASRTASSTFPTRSTACTRSPTRRRCTATSPTSTCFEVYNARLLRRDAERRGAPFRAQVRPDDGGRLGRARAPGRSAPARCGCARSATPRSS